MKKSSSKGTPTGSTGYPALEKLIDTEDFGEVNDSFAEAFDQLEKIAKSKSIKKSREAKKAQKAIELTMDLLKELLALKYQIQNELAKGKNK